MNIIYSHIETEFQRLIFILRVSIHVQIYNHVKYRVHFYVRRIKQNT